ncbi:hypothetical protein QAD02_018793 [Eretmocerus hayati]|uniref:Uncharacterized protein n=1 Tax=Eretmocerus hayati TaxID=131215 RepID=A0ACC2PHS7_9HYME|nr:hypothetical protein QAD02_018793 [Eretmocerus hayati]
MLLKSTTRRLMDGRIILASGSPRRQELLENLGLRVEVIPSNFDENLIDTDKYKHFGDYVIDLATSKVQEVAKRLREDGSPEPLLIIGADTIVTKGKKIYGKPRDDEDARMMLLNFSGNCLFVHTGVCLKTPEKEVKFAEFTEVVFGHLSLKQIEAYVETGEPKDKAGGFGVQGKGGYLIERICGDYFTVVGLPMYSTIKHLNTLFG